MNDRRTEARSIFDASPRAARGTWIINGSLFAIGASVSTLMHFLGSPKESTEPRLFFLFIQFVLFLMPLFMDLNWRGFQAAFRHSEQFQRARDARFRQMDSELLYFGMCGMMVFMESIVFVMTLASSFVRSQ
jgi:hypothetical protein